MGEVSPPADEFEVTVFLFGAEDTYRFSGTVNEWAVPGPGFFIAVCALEVIFTEFYPTGSCGIDLDQGRCSAGFWSCDWGQILCLVSTCVDPEGKSEQAGCEYLLEDR